MPDIPLAEAMVIWHPIEGSGGAPLKVVGGHVNDDKQFLKSFGACDGDFAEADPDKKLRMLFAQVINLTVNDGVAPQAVHEAFMVIPEYREALQGGYVIPAPEKDGAE